MRGWLLGAALLAGLAGATGATVAHEAQEAQEAQIKFYGEGADRKKVDALHGKPAVELQDLTWLQGGPVKLAALKGKVVLLDFWAQW